MDDTVPDMGEIFTQCGLEIVDDYVVGAFLGGEAEREGFFPRQLGGEPAGEAAGVAAMVSEFSLRLLLLGEGELEEVVHVTVGVRNEGGIDAVIGDEEEAVFLACFSDESRSFEGGGGVAGEEAGQVDEWDGELRGVRRRLLVVRPYELRGDVWVVLKHGGVEDQWLWNDVAFLVDHLVVVGCFQTVYSRCMKRLG